MSGERQGRMMVGALAVWVALWLCLWTAVSCSHGGVPGRPFYQVSLQSSKASDESGSDPTAGSPRNVVIPHGKGDTKPEKGAIGAACKKDGDCNVGFCAVNFPDGYCTAACDDSPCPDKAYCGFSSSGQFCYATCANDADCRDGYTCAMAGVPHCVPQGKAAMGGPCDNGGRCASGVCLFEYCGEDLCPSGYCSGTCKKDKDCPGGYQCTESTSGSFCMKP